MELLKRVEIPQMYVKYLDASPVSSGPLRVTREPGFLPDCLNTSLVHVYEWSYNIICDNYPNFIS